MRARGRHRGLAVLLGTAVALVVAESALRLSMGNFALAALVREEPGSGLCYVPVPGASVEFTGTSARLAPSRAGFNADGHRGARVGPRRPGVARIVFLGDSFTFGFGVDVDDTPSASTAIRLGSQGIAAEIVNLGVFGYGTAQEARWLSRQAPRLRPDAVVLLHVANDLDPDDCMLGLAGRPWMRTTLLHSALARALWFRWLDHAHRSPVAPDALERRLAAHREDVTTIVHAARANGAHTYAVVISLDPRMGNGVLSNFAAAGIPWFDGRRVVDTHPGSSDLLPGDPHLNAAANRRLGAAIADWLRAVGALDPGGDGRGSTPAHAGGG